MQLKSVTKNILSILKLCIKEWIAYHYYFIKLRHLVICVDPYSTTSPNDINIVDKWKPSGLKIDLWEFKQPKEETNLTSTELVNLHRVRQRTCYKRCLRHLKKHKRTWTILIDADEYMTFNSVTNDDDKAIYAQINESHYNSTYKYVGPKINPKHEHSKSLKDRTKYRRDMLTAKRVLVPQGISSGKTISNFIYDETEKQNSIPWKDSSCIVLPRLQFSDEEEINTKIIQNGIPLGFQASNFSTLKLFTHAKKGDYEQNRAGKCIVDVTKLKKFTISNPHKINSEVRFILIHPEQKNY